MPGNFQKLRGNQNPSLGLWPSSADLDQTSGDPSAVSQGPFVKVVTKQRKSGYSNPAFGYFLYFA